MRQPMKTANLAKLAELIDESLLTIETNLEDERFDQFGTREVKATIKITPTKQDPNDVEIIYSVETKLPKRLARLDHGALRDGCLVVDHFPEDVAMFPVRQKGAGE